MILNRILYYYKKEGIRGVINSIRTKFLIVCQDRQLVNHYFLYNDIGNNGFLRNEMDRWVCFNKLYKEYYSFINELPLYNTSGVKNHVIWWCWLQGEENAPNLCKACLRSLKVHLPSYQLKIITENNFHEYVKLPQFIITKYKNGTIGKAHFSDIIRTALLVEYGGIWIDSTVYCTGYKEKIFDSPFFVFQNYQLAGYPSAIASNWLISAEKNHPILHTMLDVLYRYWEKHDKANHYFFYHILFHIVVQKYEKLWIKMPRYSNIPPHYMQNELFKEYDESLANRLRQQSDFHKLSYKFKQLSEDTSGLFVEKILNNQI